MQSLTDFRSREERVDSLTMFSVVEGRGAGGSIVVEGGQVGSSMAFIALGMGATGVSSLASMVKS